MKAFAILCAAPVLVAAAPTPDGETVKDIRCFLAMSAAASSEDKAASMGGMIGAQYFLGRIDGRSPNLDWEAALSAEGAQLTDADMKPLLQGCGELMKSRGQAIQAVGEQLQKKGL